MLKKICSFISTILLIGLLALAAVLVLPKFLGYTQLAVLSGSMAPKIQVGDLVYVKEVDPLDLKEGDIITYQLTTGTRVTHRIVSINLEEENVVTQGDANDATDASPVAFSNIVGIYAFHLPYLGYLSIYGKSPLGIAAACGIMMLVILLNFLPDALSNPKEEQS